METNQTKEISIPKYSNYIRVHHVRKSNSIQHNRNYFDENPEILNRNSSGMTNQGNKSFERAVTAISRIERRNVFGDQKQEEDEKLKRILEHPDNNFCKKQEIILSAMDFSKEPAGNLKLFNQNSHEFSEELFRNGKNDTIIYEMEKFNFIYFFIRIKFREPPLKIGFLIKFCKILIN